MSLPLPFELVDAIIECLSGYLWTLKSCALIARAWTSPSQRALFYDIDLFHARMPDGLLHHLAHHPHLPPLIRCIRLSEFPPGSDEIDASQYANSVAALLRSLTQLTSMTVSYLPGDPGPFPLVLADFISKSSLKAITIKGFYTQYNFQQALSSLEGSQIKRVSFVSLGVQEATPGFIPHVVRLPSVEFLSLKLGTNRYAMFQFWFAKPHITFPRLKHCDLTTLTLAEMKDCLNWLRQSTLRLDSLKVELSRIAFKYVSPPPENALSVFDGLHCTHLEITQRRAPEPAVIEWWSVAFQSLADSGPTIHFTTLTLTIRDGSKHWGSLVGVLSHDVFSAVQKIYH